MDLIGIAQTEEEMQSIANFIQQDEPKYTNQVAYIRLSMWSLYCTQDKISSLSNKELAMMLHFMCLSEGINYEEYL